MAKLADRGNVRKERKERQEKLTFYYSFEYDCAKKVQRIRSGIGNYDDLLRDKKLF